MPSQRILGIAASLRNARWGAGNRNLVSNLYSISAKEELFDYLGGESQRHLNNYAAAGQGSGKNSLEVFESLHKAGGSAGLSNSEITLAAALWAAQREGAEIEHVSLAEHFTASGQLRQPEILRKKLLEADGMLVSGPVYFGDRGSLAESLIQFILGDSELRAAMRGRLYAGISVGAKRNGGQETTLIYQMLDMLSLGLLAVGNDSETTAQYGGTGHAGDVGTMHKDIYGLDTSMGTGRRMARVLKLFGARPALIDLPRTLFLVLQDAHDIGARTVDRLVALFGRSTHATVINVTGRHINRCIACDTCPTEIGPDEEYRCITATKEDCMKDIHQKMLDHDLIVPVGVSLPEAVARSKYQLFVERTRYLRHCDYIWSDVLVTPLVLEERSDFRSLPIRMMTSFLRHHTVMGKPMIGILQDEEVTNKQQVEEGFSRTLGFAARLAAGRLALAREAEVQRRYNPIGYAQNLDLETECEADRRRAAAGEARRHRLITEAEKRLEDPRVAVIPLPAVAHGRPEAEQEAN